MNLNPECIIFRGNQIFFCRLYEFQYNHTVNV